MKIQIIILAAIATLVAACEKEDTNYPENTLPEILSITTPKLEVESGEQIQIRCDAVDADGDSLTYEWKSEFGTINLQYERTCMWTAPLVDKPSGLNVYVTVSDNRIPSSKVSRDIIITVLPE